MANGSEIFLTAEFGSECSFTSASLGMAPASCSCVPPTFTTCPTNQTANTPSNACAIAVNYTAMAGAVGRFDAEYVFTGMTTGSGSGTGSGTVFNRE